MTALRLLPLACLVAAGLLIAAEMSTVFELRTPAGEVADTQAAGGRHGYALVVIAVFALGAHALAILNGSRPAAMAVAAMGAIALLIFLAIDLPDVGQTGALGDSRRSLIDAEAVPAGGFWLELFGALGLTVTGIALATLTPDQMQALIPDRSDRSRTASPNGS